MQVVFNTLMKKAWFKIQIMQSFTKNDCRTEQKECKPYNAQQLQEFVQFLIVQICSATI